MGRESVRIRVKVLIAAQPFCVCQVLLPMTYGGYPSRFSQNWVCGICTTWGKPTFNSATLNTCIHCKVHKGRFNAKDATKTTWGPNLYVLWGLLQDISLQSRMFCNFGFEIIDLVILLFVLRCASVYQTIAKHCALRVVCTRRPPHSTCITCLLSFGTMQTVKFRMQSFDNRQGIFVWPEQCPQGMPRPRVR